MSRYALLRRLASLCRAHMATFYFYVIDSKHVGWSHFMKHLASIANKQISFCGNREALRLLLSIVSKECSEQSAITHDLSLEELQPSIARNRTVSRYWLSTKSTRHPASAKRTGNEYTNVLRRTSYLLGNKHRDDSYRSPADSLRLV